MPPFNDIDPREQPTPPDEPEHWHLQKGIPVALITGLLFQLAVIVWGAATHDREVMAWVGNSGGGISGEMIRDMMLDCVERRFDALRAPQPVQWLADNGSAYTAGETIDFAVALNLVAYFTPVRSPESNGVCETFVKTFKRDYVRVNPRPNAVFVLQRLAEWLEDYNTVHPYSGLRMGSPLDLIGAQSATTQAACPV